MERAESVWGSRPAVGWGDSPLLPKLSSQIRGLQFSKSVSRGPAGTGSGWVGRGGCRGGREGSDEQLQWEPILGLASP